MRLFFSCHTLSQSSRESREELNTSSSPPKTLLTWEQFFEWKSLVMYKVLTREILLVKTVMIILLLLS